MSDAEKWYLEALRIFRLVLGEGHESVADICGGLGEIYSGQGRLEEAVRMHKLALRVYRRASEGDSAAVASALSGLGS
eukprot:CAMPEP_0173421040 /NCGR_PEP_ID=MMETSP1357-20121228/2290_1 /TAXON_ID=77926 /ORGANISM="Hemiselmis rufescens, Strain PCC563" /LENGTH=77 /DNA_ID=CAMNT_0014383905 /DNA_START=324 /DNA_END=554 /DNA_ORIENTATION=+